MQSSYQPETHGAARIERSRAEIKDEAKAFLRLYYAENALPGLYPERWPEIEAEIDQAGHYTQTFDELEYGSKLAWRNSTRCGGRLHWQNLVVNDCRELKSADEIFAALVDHLRGSAGNGKIAPMITIFSPEQTGQRPVRIWNRQLIDYAGYRQSDGSIIGDPLNVRFTQHVQKLGWNPQTQGRFDVLPVLIEAYTGLRWFDWPDGLIPEVQLRHPQYGWFEDLQLKWYTLPAVSRMRLEIGGINYPAAPFSGWYVGSEVGARDLADVDRYNLLPIIAKRLGLDTRTDRSLWKDRALVELNIAVLHSFAQAEVTMIDHHTASRQFLLHEERELKAGRATYADWSWIVPPLSGSTTPTFHRTFENKILSPNFYCQPQLFDDGTTAGCPWHGGRMTDKE
jgi:nitric-oxide synthase